MNAKAQLIQRASGPLGRPLAWAIGTAGFVGGMMFMAIPAIGQVIGAAIQHTADRFRNGVDKDYELKIRTKFYRQQIAKQLGIAPDKVGLAEFRMAAQINPHLEAAYNDVLSHESRENRNSLLMSAGAAAVPVLGHGATVAKHVVQGVRMVGQGFAGLGVSMLFNKDIVSSQEVVEAIGNDLLKAKQQGIDPRQAVTANAVFMLRVAQDEKFGADILNQYGKRFHKMTAEEQQVVMGKFPALASTAATEASAVAAGILPVQDLGATAPNLSGFTQNIASRGRNGGSWRDTVKAQEAAAPQVNGPAA